MVCHIFDTPFFLSLPLFYFFREIGVLRNVEPPTRPRLECLRETGLILRCDRKVGTYKRLIYMLESSLRWETQPILCEMLQYD